MASLIWFSLTGSRYWSYRVAIGLPVLSVTVVTSGGGMSARSEDVFSTVSLALLDMTPAAPTTGKSMPATSTPASRQRPMSLNKPSAFRTRARLPGLSQAPVTPCLRRCEFSDKIDPLRSHQVTEGILGLDGGNRGPLQSVNVSRRQAVGWINASGSSPGPNGGTGTGEVPGTDVSRGRPARGGQGRAVPFPRWCVDHQR